jgi:hypothetical protein
VDMVLDRERLATPEGIEVGGDPLSMKNGW